VRQFVLRLITPASAITWKEVQRFPTSCIWCIRLLAGRTVISDGLSGRQIINVIIRRRRSNSRRFKAKLHYASTFRGYVGQQVVQRTHCHALSYRVKMYWICRKFSMWYGVTYCTTCCGFSVDFRFVSDSLYNLLTRHVFVCSKSWQTLLTRDWLSVKTD